MGRVRKSIAAGGAAIACLWVSAGVTAQDRGRPVNGFAAQLLDLHNDARGSAGVGELAWSGRLAAEAQQWANELARRGQIQHSTRDARRGAGENLWMGSAGYYDADAMIGAFIAERRNYMHGTFPQVSRTGRWTDVGHYTQIVWRETQEVGCAVAQGRQNDFLVCRYWPAGNTYGKKAY
ncbi:CAP domain-containing protein [Altererythrobacter sp. CAU 1778]